MTGRHANRLAKDISAGTPNFDPDPLSEERLTTWSTRNTYTRRKRIRELRRSMTEGVATEGNRFVRDATAPGYSADVLPRPTREFAARCLCIDLEVGPRDSRIHRFAGVQSDTGQAFHFR